MSGNITVDPSVGGLATLNTPVVEGIYITSPTGTFKTGTSTVVGKERLVGQGMFVAGGGTLPLQSLPAGRQARLLFSMPDSPSTRFVRSGLTHAGCADYVGRSGSVIQTKKLDHLVDYYVSL